MGEQVEVAEEVEDQLVGRTLAATARMGRNPSSFIHRPKERHRNIPLKMSNGSC